MSLLKIVHSEGEIAARELHEKYEAKWENRGRTKRQRRNMLEKLAKYNYIEAEGKSRWRRYRSLLDEAEVVA
ncbi:hypothetical protein ACFQMM_03585 [Saliphagus sp. GCM10025308]